MPATGGNYKAAWFGGRRFAIIGSNKPMLLDGDEVDIEMNGDGETWRELREAKPKEFPGIEIEIDDNRGDHEYLVGFQNSGGGDIIFEGPLGDRQLTGNITGRIETDFSDAKSTVNVKGGKVKKL